MEVIGTILIVVGFLIGVYGGVVLCDPKAMVLPSGEINKSKEVMMSIVIGGAFFMLMIGTLLLKPIFQ